MARFNRTSYLYIHGTEVWLERVINIFMEQRCCRNELFIYSWNRGVVGTSHLYIHGTEVLSERVINISMEQLELLSESLLIP